MNHLVKFGLAVFAIFIVFSMFSRCSTSSINPSIRAQRAIESETQVVLREKAKGLDLAAVTALAKKAKDAADFERLLNSKEEAVNNLDLNEDLIVDYIKVSEYGSGDHRGFSLSTELSPGEVQEIATIDFQKKEQQVTAQTTGNSSLYGPGNFFHSNFDITDALLLGYIFTQRQPYISPYGYGNYPPNYGRGWYRDSDDSYQSRTTVRNSRSTVSQSSQPKMTPPVISPNAEKTAAKARALTTATQSQRSFSSSSSSRPSSSSSFGSSSSSSSSSTRSTSGGFGRSSSSSSSRSGSFSRGGK